MKVFGWVVLHPDGLIAAGGETRRAAVAAFVRDYGRPGDDMHKAWHLARRDGVRAVKIRR